MFFLIIINLNASKIETGELLFIIRIIFMSQEQNKMVEKYRHKRSKWDFKLHVPPENYYYTFNSSWDILFKWQMVASFLSKMSLKGVYFIKDFPYSRPLLYYYLNLDNPTFVS